MTFLLAHYQKLRYKDIASILEIPLGTVKSRMAAAEKELRVKLKHFLQDQGE